MVFNIDELKWIEDNRSLIDSEDFKEIFKKSGFGSKLNEAFLELGLDPLQGLDEIPGGYFQESCITSITIPNSVTSIGGSAFSACSSLTSITIPNSVTNIGNSAFSYCSSLTNIAIPNSVTSIGDYAFSGCRSLTSIIIPDSITNIESSAFSYCSSLISVTIPDSVTSIGDYAFWGCRSLAKIIFNGTIEQWEAINKGFDWKGESSIRTIECIDGVIRIG